MKSLHHNHQNHWSCWVLELMKNLSRYAEANREVVRNNIRIEVVWRGMFPTFSFIAGIGTMLIWYKRRIQGIER
jgi:hypothetical protein